MSKAAWLALALLCAGACKDKDGESKNRTPEQDPVALPDPTAEQITGLIRGLDAVASARPEMRIATVAQLMHETVAPDDPCFADAGSELTQSQEYELDRALACVRPCALDLAELTRMAPETRIPAIRTRCKDAIGLADDDMDLLTPQLLLIARASRLLAHAHSKASGDHKQQLADGIRAAELVLPMPAWTQSYRLPTAPVAVSRPLMTEQYLTITADGQVLHHAPRARFAGGNVEVDQPEADKPADTMILADAQMSAQAVVQAGHQLGGAMLGVTGGGATAWALLVDDAAVTGQPEQRIRFGATGTRPAMTIAITGTDTVATAGQGEPRTIPRAGSAVDIEAIREVVRAWRGQPELQDATDIAIEVSGEASYRDMVDVISALAQDAPFVFDLRVTDK